VGIIGKATAAGGRQSEPIAEKTFKDRHNIARILFSLEKHGYVERQPDENDKRAYRLFLTDAGGRYWKPQPRCRKSFFPHV
jgi:DNA-binding MarR family transcriptional regulator